jgi:hypothetical protein
MSGIRSILTAVGRVSLAPAITITAYLLDDHEIVRRGLRELLECIDDLLAVGESGPGSGGGPAVPLKCRGLMPLFVGQTG